MSAFADVLGCGQVKLVMFDSRVTAVSVLPPGVRAGYPPPPGRSLFWNSRLSVLEVLYAEHSPDPPMWAETSSQHCSHDSEKRSKCITMANGSDKKRAAGPLA